MGSESIAKKTLFLFEYLGLKRHKKGNSMHCHSIKAQRRVLCFWLPELSGVYPHSADLMGEYETLQDNPIPMISLCTQSATRILVLKEKLETGFEQIPLEEGTVGANWPQQLPALPSVKLFMKAPGTG